jgi:hypothetical protein
VLRDRVEGAGLVITALFISPDGTAVAIEYDEGDGGLVVVESGYNEVADIEVVPGDWKRVEP